MKKQSTLLTIATILFNNNIIPATPLSTMADPSSARSTNARVDFKGGAGVGRLILSDAVDLENYQCKYDMVLVERIQNAGSTKEKTESGLFVPRENLPKLHLCRVISMGPGREEENGLIQPMPNIQPGDIVIAKHPWGIGPKDEETADGKKLSFMRGGDIAAVVMGKLVEK